MLTDPHDALAEQNTVATALTGLAGMARLVRVLAAAPAHDPAPAADDFVHVLLAVAGLGEAITRLAREAPPAPEPAPPRTGEWLR